MEILLIEHVNVCQMSIWMRTNDYVFLAHQFTQNALLAFMIRLSLEVSVLHVLPLMYCKMILAFIYQIALL